MAGKKATKKSKKVPSSAEIEISKDRSMDGSTYTLGDSTSESEYKRAMSGGESNFRLKYGQDKNVFALVHPDFAVVQEHWVTLGEDTHRLVCPVHTTNDAALIGNSYGWPDGCPFCAHKKALYEEAPKDSKDVVDIKKREIARELSANSTYYMYAIQGDGMFVKEGKSVYFDPTFENRIVRKLTMSKSAFTLFFDEFRKQSLTQGDVPGLPVNFIGGKNAAGYEKIEKIEFYPNSRISDIPRVPSDFGGIADVDKAKIDEVYNEVQKLMPQILAGKVNFGSRKKK